jgi:hypothetical protein
LQKCCRSKHSCGLHRFDRSCGILHRDTVPHQLEDENRRGGGVSHSRVVASCRSALGETLNLLAKSTHGYREANLMARGFAIEMLRGLVREGLVIAK